MNKPANKPTAAAALGSADITRSGLRLSNEQIVAAVNKAVGSEAIRVYGSRDRSNVEARSTGNISVDLMLGIGGLPIGRIFEVFGPEGGGKTTFCLSVIAEAQRSGGRAAFIDVEHALDPQYARTCGVNLDELLLSQPDSGEDALRIAESLIRLNCVDVIVVDSVAALISREELNGEIGDATMGSQARLMSQAMRRLTAVVSKSKVRLMFTNQIREKIRVMFGNPEVTPGGRALKFFASIRIDVRGKDKIKDSSGTVIGQEIRLKTVKNKVAAPYKEALCRILWTEGLSSSHALLTEGLAAKVFEKKGAWVAYEGQMLGQGLDAAAAVLRSNSALAAKAYAQIMAKVLTPAVPPVQVDESVVKLAAGTNGDSVLNGAGELDVGDVASAAA